MDPFVAIVQNSLFVFWAGYFHRKLVKIPPWERNAKFSLHWENDGTRKSFLGKNLGIRISHDLLNGFLLGNGFTLFYFPILGKTGVSFPMLFPML